MRAKSSETVSILVVDDDDDLRELLAMFFEQRGDDVRTASCGDEACALVRGWTPDVILCDLSLGREEGADVLARVRAELRGTVAAAAISGFCDRATRERALARGFQSYLTKPVDLGALASAVVSLAARDDRAVMAR